MSADQNRDLIRRFIETANEHLRKRDDWLPYVEQLYAEDAARRTNMLPGLAPGPEGEKEWGRVLQTAFPDLQVAIEDLVADGDQVVGRFTLRGTHSGDFAGIPPTGKQVAWHQIYWYRLQDGKIVEYWGEQDVLGLLRQLGVTTWEPRLPR